MIAGLQLSMIGMLRDRQIGQLSPPSTTHSCGWNGSDSHMIMALLLAIIGTLRDRQIGH